QINNANHQYKVEFLNGRKFKPDSITRICGIIDKSAALLGWNSNNIIDYLRTAITPGVEHAESYLEELYEIAKKENRRKKSEAASRGVLVHSLLAGENQEATTPNLKVTHAREWLK